MMGRQAPSECSTSMSARTGYNKLAQGADTETRHYQPRVNTHRPRSSDTTKIKIYKGETRKQCVKDQIQTG